MRFFRPTDGGGQRLVLFAAVFLLGLCVSAFAAWQLHRNIDNHARADFEHNALRLEEEVGRRIRQPVYGLRGANGVYAASPTVDRAAFRAYVASRDLPKEFPGVRGFGFVQRVLPSELKAFEAAERADGAPAFSVHDLQGRAPDAGQNEHWIIKYLEPAADVNALLGMDVGTTRDRREAIETAVATGQPALTSLTMLLRGNGDTPGVVMYLPVFGHGAQLTTPAERAAGLIGLLVASIALDDALRGQFDVAAGLLDFALYDDIQALALGHAAFDTAAASTPTPTQDQASEHRARFEVVHTFPLLGREMTIRVRSKSGFDASYADSTPWAVFASGFLVSLLLAVLFWQQTSGRRRAEVLAGRMTADLDRLAQIARHTTNSVWISDREMRMTWINDGFTRISGYTSDEALGKTPAEVVGSGKADPAVMRTLAEAAAAGVGCRVEILNRHKDGRNYWMDIEVQPLHDTHGQLTGFMEIGTDITASKEAASELSRERQRLNNILEGTHVGTFEWDVETGKTVLNERWAQMLGFMHEELLDTTVSTLNELTHPEDLSRSAVHLERHFNGETPGYECEIRLRHKQGHWIWVLSRGKLFSRSEDGRPQWMAGTHQDISIRKQAETALRASQKLLDRTGQIGGVGGWELDIATQTVQWTDQTCRIHDREPGHQPTLVEAIGYYTPEARPIMERAVQDSLASGKPFDLELPFTTATGRSIWVRAVGEAEFVDGKPVRLVGAFQDITERKHAQARLKQASDRLHGSIDALDDAYALFDADDNMVLCNQRYRDLYPLMGELMQPGARFEDIVRAGAERGQYADAIGRVEEFVAERLATHRQASSTVTRRLGDGRTLRIGERRMADGHIVGYHVDITDFVRATEAAQEASRSKSQFLANMSHEIRTPMNAILGMLALLRKTNLTVRQTDYAVKTEGAARSLLGLLNDILDFSKVEAGKMTLDPQPFRFDQLLRDLAVILSANVGNKNIEVLFDVDPQLPRHLIGDAMRLMQVLINLSGNAIKFTERGEVVVSLALTSRTKSAVVVNISVRDSGIGIAPENQARIFSGFTQAEASTTRRFGGTGLGLAISKRLVAMMGGELRLESSVGQGSRFYFDVELPLAPQTLQEAAATPSVAMHTRLHMLVVDDNRLARDVLDRMIASLGWSVDLVESGEQALATLQSHPGAYDAVFVDWLMPGMDGWQTCEKIRELSLIGEAPLVVMVTAHGREMLAQRPPNEQKLVDGFLVKPVTASMLYDAIIDAHAEHGGTPGQRTRTATSERRLEGLRLLLAEDNANNQQVARELLESEGAQVQIANNGREAVEAVSAAGTPFDAILMDLQMPVMDGYTATSRIRQDLGRINLPIIAMTANAMASDREACLAAGMNDHVGKPFDLDTLVKVLRRLAGLSVSQVPSQLAVLPPENFSPAVAAAAAAAGVDLVSAVRRLGGKLGVYRRCLGSFVRDLGPIYSALTEPAVLEDWLAAARELHTLKGVAATLGVTRLVAVAADGETLLKGTPTPQQAAAVLAQVRATITEVRSALSSLFVALDDGLQTSQASALPSEPTQQSPEDRAALIDALASLKHMLVDSDMGAIEALAGLRAKFPYAVSAELQPLDQAIAELDFEAAQRHCNDWLTACQAQGIPS